MSLRLFWKITPKHKRELLLSVMGPIEQKQFRKIVEGKTDFPKCFSSRKAIFVHVPKTAGSSICDAVFGVSRVGHMPYSWYEKISPESCENYFTFTFVRNPWDRAVSAYHYLLSGGAHKRDEKWSKLVRKYNSFDDFVLQWIYHENVQKIIHFVPQIKFIESGDGSIDIDYIGRFEDINSDLSEINSLLSCNENIVLKLSRIKASNRGNYRNYYSKESSEIIANVYSRDISLFGYDF